MVRILSEGEVAELLELPDFLSVVETTLVAQGRGDVERPERPHFPVGTGLGDDFDEPLGTGLTMPAYVHGADRYATKLASVHPGNENRDLPTVNAQIALTDARTGRPRAYMAGTRITNARTGCIGGLAARELADEPITLGVIGAGTQARWQAHAIAAASEVESIRVYAPSDSREACATDLETVLGIPTEAVETSEDAVFGASVVVTATTSTEPVFPGSALDPDTLVIAVGAYTPETRELDAETIERAETLVADVPEEAAETGDLAASGVSVENLVPLAAIFEDAFDCPEGIVVVESVGSAVLDAASAEHVFERAREAGVGTTVAFD